MISYTEEYLLSDKLPDYSVIIHQCNNRGWMDQGISKEIAKKWPESFKEFNRYCSFFKNGHEKEILGTFVEHHVSTKLIICNAIAQNIVGKVKRITDYDAWEVLCKKIERQTKAINHMLGKKWTLHIQYKIGCNTSNGSWDEMLNIFKKYFENSEVELVIHN